MKKSDVLDICDLSLATVNAHVILLLHKTDGHMGCERLSKARDRLDELKAILRDYRVNEPKGGDE